MEAIVMLYVCGAAYYIVSRAVLAYEDGGAREIIRTIIPVLFFAGWWPLMIFIENEH